MNNILSRHSTKKIISLSFTILIIANHTNFQITVLAQNKKNYVQTSFSEKYPTASRLLILIGKASGCIGGLVGSHYFIQWGLDKLHPERIEHRKLIEEATKEKESAQIELIELNKLKQPTDNDLKKTKELRSKISDYENILKSKDNGFDYIKKLWGIGGLATVFNIGYNSVCKIKDVCEATAYVGTLEPTFKRIKIMSENIKEHFKRPSKIYTVSEILSNFDKTFFDLEGQEEAKKNIRSFIYDNALAKDEAKWDNKKYNHGDILYFYGPSGVGKSFAANHLPYVFSPNPNVFTLSSSDIDKEKFGESIVSQIFSPGSAVPQNPSQPSKKSPLVEFIKNNPGGFVKIEEYDKLCSPALDEVLRTIAENGTINASGEKIDCSGTTFILTSNEDDISMRGFDKDHTEKISEEAIQEGYTRVWHDKSFLNRIRKIKFDKLTSKAFEQILHKRFESKAKYWLDPQNGGFKLLIDNASIQKLAKKVEYLNQGARPIDLTILPQCQTLVVQTLKSAKTFDFYKNKKMNIHYDDKEDKFYLS